jgi:photosystem II stability/assembly factor-like uncharacterized protein
VSELEGWGIDYDGNIVHTIDRGWHWQVQRSDPNRSMVSIYFVDSAHGWVAGSGIMHTDDGGVTWKYQVQPRNVFRQNTFGQIYFLDSQKGWALDFFGAAFTTDGGKNWTPLPEDWRKPILDRADKEQQERIKNVGSSIRD